MKDYQSGSEPVSKIRTLDEVIVDLGFGKFHLIFIAIFGVMQACDAIEMLVLAFLGPILSCAWQVSALKESLLTTAVFVGMLFGGPGIGKLCDIFGRKSMLMITAFTLSYFGLFSAAVPTIGWMIGSRAIIGALLGGIMSCVATFTSEIIPAHYRGSALIFIIGCWPIGSYFITTICMLTLSRIGWRWFLVVGSCPLILILAFFAWLPESPRFLLLKNRKTEALQVLNQIAKLNGREPIDDVESPQLPKYSYTDLFHPYYRLTFFLVIIMWIISGLSYYSIVLLTTVIDKIPRSCEISPKVNITKDNSCCTPLDMSSFVEVYISTSGEIIFLPITFALVSFLGRKPTFIIYGLTIPILFGCLNLCVSNLTISLILLVLRGCTNSSFVVNYLYASEVFPTSVRGLAIGLCNGAARIGSMMASFVVLLLCVERHSLLPGTTLLVVCNILGLICALLLPIETRDRPLHQTSNDCHDQKKENQLQPSNDLDQTHQKLQK